MGPSPFHLVPVFYDPLLGRCRCDSITYGDAIHCPQWRLRQGEFCRRLCQSIHDIIVLDVFLFLVRVVSFDHPVAWDPSPSQLLGLLVCLYYLPQVYIRAFPMWCKHNLLIHNPDILLHLSDLPTVRGGCRCASRLKVYHMFRGLRSARALLPLPPHDAPQQACHAGVCHKTSYLLLHNLHPLPCTRTTNTLLHAPGSLMDQ